MPTEIPDPTTSAGLVIYLSGAAVGALVAAIILFLRRQPPRT